VSWAHLLAGVSAAVALEGIAYALFPAAMRRAAAGIASIDPARLRAGGLAAAAAGTAAAWLIASP